MNRTFGRAMSAMARESCCCSPPERLPAGWPARSARMGNSSSASARPRAACGGIAAELPGGEAEVLGDGEGREDAAPAGHHGDPGAGDVVGAASAEGSAVVGEVAVDVRHAADERLEDGGLAGAVGAEQGEDLAVGDVEVDAEEDLEGPVGGGEVAARDQPGGRGRPVARWLVRWRRGRR